MKENEYLPLLFKRFTGDISAVEESELNSWIAQSPENERIANEYTLVWSASGNYSKKFSPDLDTDFAKVQARIRAVEQPILKVQRFNNKIYRVAAALALLSMSMWGYSKFGSSEYFDAMASATKVEKQLVSLSDGTKVWLREGSSIQYANSFSGKKERRVKLSGEAYFEVAHDPQHPFRVELTNGASVEVLGTAFDVRQSEESTTVLVRSGKVMFSPDARTKSPALTANQKAVFDHKAKSLKITPVYSLNELAWQTGGLEFIKTPLSQVALDLSRYYKVKILLNNPALADCPHSALLSNQSLRTVLDGLVVAYQVKVSETSPGEYTLSGGRCQ